jgi:RNA polymerase sigma factor (TIGR02999 family)
MPGVDRIDSPIFFLAFFLGLARSDYAWRGGREIDRDLLGAERMGILGAGRMADESPEDFTQLIEGARAGRGDAQAELFRAFYREFHGIAEALMRNERPDHSLQPSALVNEAVLRLLTAGVIDRASSRRYLIGAAAKAMRETLVDHARHRDAQRRGGGWKRHPLDQVHAYFVEQTPDVLSLDEALDRLAAIHERPSRVVEMRFFAGLTVAEVAESLGVSVGTVEGDWKFARAWLHRELGGLEA